MSYRIYLHTDKEDLEILDETPINHLEVVKGTENKEYKSYVVNKEDMLDIILFYAKHLQGCAGHYVRDPKRSITSRLGFEYYFKGISCNNLIRNSDSFFLQYFYFVELYKQTDWENIHLTITHG